MRRRCYAIETGCRTASSDGQQPGILAWVKMSRSRSTGSQELHRLASPIGATLGVDSQVGRGLGLSQVGGSTNGLGFVKHVRFVVDRRFLDRRGRQGFGCGSGCSETNEKGLSACFSEGYVREHQLTLFPSFERVVRMIVGTISNEIMCPVTPGQQHADLALHLAKHGPRLVFQGGREVGGRGGSRRSSLRVGVGSKHVGLERIVVRVIEFWEDSEGFDRFNFDLAGCEANRVAKSFVYDVRSRSRRRSDRDGLEMIYIWMLRVTYH